MLGSSQSNYYEDVRVLVKKLQPKRLLELGCGTGTFLKNNVELRNKVTTVQKIFSVNDRDQLENLGYSIIDEDILEYYRTGFDEKYELVVALDVIEHFLFSDAISIIDFSLYRSDWMLLVWPSRHPQDAVTSSFDRHRTSFELRDLTNRFEVSFYKQTGFADICSVHRYHLALIRGHMNLMNQ